MFNELIIIEIILILSIIYFLNTSNLLTAWYLAGIFLFALGAMLLHQDGDIFVGFLWVIDLGVGLIFLLFILHFSIFLKHKTSNMLSTRLVVYAFIALMTVGIYFYYETFPIAVTTKINTNLIPIAWFDYYDLLITVTITDLNIMREAYFFNNSWEFVIINFMLLYGIITTILLTFLVQRTFNFLTSSFLTNTPAEMVVGAGFFIRTQNFALQQQMSTGTRVWMKTKNNQI